MENKAEEKDMMFEIVAAIIDIAVTIISIIVTCISIVQTAMENKKHQKSNRPRQ